MSDRVVRERNLVVRHSVVELAEHWAVALSGLALLVSGMFQLPMGSRYYINSVPGLAWSADFMVSLNVHYAASMVFVAASLFHVVYHGLRGERGMIPRRGDLKTSIEVMKSFLGKGKEPPFHKYLPEQRLAYIGMAVIIAMLIVSGLVKTYKNLYAPDLSYTVVLWATWVHNVGFVLFILAFAAHIGAIVLKPNRPMLRGILTGAVRLDYAEHRHPLWIGEIEGAKPEVKAEPPETAPDRAADREEAPAAVEAAGEVPAGSQDAGGKSAAVPQEPDDAEPGCAKPRGESPPQG
jgi:cytochrome b subunit of formate dehydrogenase